MSQETLGIGKLIHPSATPERDAIHVAVAPVIAEHSGLRPGMSLVFSRVGNTEFVAMAGSTYDQIGRDQPGRGIVGIVDPFLNQDELEQGQRFWMFLFPGTIQSLRHEWVHPAWVEAKADNFLENEQYLRSAAEAEGMSLESLIALIKEQYQPGDTYIHTGDRQMYGLATPEFFRRLNAYTGMSLPESTYFTCAC